MLRAQKRNQFKKIEASFSCYLIKIIISDSYIKKIEYLLLNLLLVKFAPLIVYYMFKQQNCCPCCWPNPCPNPMKYDICL